jgi:hypothetical protein
LTQLRQILFLKGSNGGGGTPAERSESAYKEGVSEAEKELREGTATFYIWGLRNSAESLDRRTGIPLEVLAGCAIDAETHARATGHNRTIRKYIHEVGLPANSFKRWEKDLFDLAGYYERRSKTERPSRLTFDGPAAKSTDGKYAIRLLSMKFHEYDGTIIDDSALIINVSGVDRTPIIALCKKDADLLWGPKGSGFAVIRCHGEHGTWFTAVDLNRGKILRDSI